MSKFSTLLFLGSSSSSSSSSRINKGSARNCAWNCLGFRSSREVPRKLLAIKAGTYGTYGTSQKQEGENQLFLLFARAVLTKPEGGETESTAPQSIYEQKRR
jgi:hypothetical protein